MTKQNRYAQIIETAQFMRDNVIALFEFEQTKDGIAIAAEKHYRLVHPDEVSTEELRTYRQRTV